MLGYLVAQFTGLLVYGGLLAGTGMIYRMVTQSPTGYPNVDGVILVAGYLVWMMLVALGYKIVSAKRKQRKSKETTDS